MGTSTENLSQTGAQAKRKERDQPNADPSPKKSKTHAKKLKKSAEFVPHESEEEPVESRNVADKRKAVDKGKAVDKSALSPEPVSVLHILPLAMLTEMTAIRL